jgi:hypothetical protein
MMMRRMSIPMVGRLAAVCAGGAQRGVAKAGIPPPPHEQFDLKHSSFKDKSRRKDIMMDKTADAKKQEQSKTNQRSKPSSKTASKSSRKSK